MEFHKKNRLAVNLAVLLSLGATTAPALAQATLPDVPVPKLSIDPHEATKVSDDLTGMSLEALMDVRVSTLSRINERIDEAPGSVYQFGRDSIAQRGYHSLGDLLRVVPGFTVFHRDLQFVAGVRGLNANDNEKMSLLINGQNVNGVNEPDFLNGPINLDSAQRVEVVVGPSSLFQQANTLAATVNVITRDVEGLGLITGVGNDLKYSATALAGHKFDSDHNFSLAVTTENKRGFDAFNGDFRPNLDGRHLVGEEDQPNYFAIAKGQAGEFFGQVIAYRTTLPELSIDNGDPRNKGKLVDEWYTGYVRIDHPITDTLMAVISGDVAYKRQSRLNEGGLPTNALQQYLSQVDFNTDWSLQYTGLNNHVIQGGLQFTYEDNLDDWYTLNTDALTIPQTTLFDKNTYAIGAYADDEFRLNDYVKLIGGVRIDQNTRLEGDRWFPGARAALVVEPTKTWVSKLSYNRAVRMPSAIGALNTAWGINSTGAPDWARLAPNATEPEVLSTIQWENIVYVDKNRLSLTVYHQDLKNFISWFGPHTNVGNFTGNGVEASADAPLTPKLTIWANASYNNSKLSPFQQYAQTNDAIENQHILTDSAHHIIGAPQVTANAGLDYKITDCLTISPSARFFTEQAGFDSDKNDFVTIRNRIYFDATLTWKNVIKDHLDLHLTVDNILNNREAVAGQWLRDTYSPQGTTVVLSMEWRF